MEDPERSLMILGLGLCLLMLGFTSAVDAAFTTINRHRLNALLNSESRARTAVSRLIDDPYRFKSTAIFLNTTITIFAASLTFQLSAGLPTWAQAGSLVLLVLSILVISEVIPKALAVRNPDATARALARPLSLISTILWPVIALINVLTQPFYRMISGRNGHPAPLVTEEELRLLVNVGEEEGLIEHEEREMIEGVFSFGDTLVREIMVPRVDVIALDCATSLGAALEIVISHGHSRIPVYEQTVDTIVGVLYAKDMIPALRDGGQEVPIRGLIRPAYYIPETMRVNVLLADLQKRKVHMAIIVDEYGVTAGLATIEDLIEQIVGEIQDEYDTEDPSVQPITEHEYIVDARVLIEDINSLLNLDLSTENADRIGGLVYELLGRVPRAGDQLNLEHVTVSVLSVKGVRAKKLRLVRHTALPVGQGVERRFESGELHHGSA